MLRFVRSNSGGHGAISRREWLRIGSLAGLGVPFSVRGAAASTGAAKPARAKSVILVYASGGQSQLDTWDPKPDAPPEIRGDFAAIDTAVPGIRICEHMPQVARVANLFTIVRSVHHEDSDHGSASYLTLTGDYHVRRVGQPAGRSGERPADLWRRPAAGAAGPRPALHGRARQRTPSRCPTFLSPGQFAGRPGGRL